MPRFSGALLFAVALLTKGPWSHSEGVGFRAVFAAGTASKSGVTTRWRLHGKRGRRHRRHRRHRGKKQHEEPTEQVNNATNSSQVDDPAKPENMSVADALDNVPARVTDLYTSYKQNPTERRAKEVMKQLNAVYRRAMKDRDTATFACSQKKYDAKKAVDDARGELRETEAALTQLVDRMQNLETGVDQSAAEINRLRETFEDHRTRCEKNRRRQREALQLLAKDMPVAKEISDEASGDCEAGESPPAMVECSLASGYVVTFKNADLRAKVAKLSGLSERLVALHLGHAVRGHGHVPTPSEEGVALPQLNATQRSNRLRGRGHQPISAVQVGAMRHRVRRQGHRRQQHHRRQRGHRRQHLFRAATKRRSSHSKHRNSFLQLAVLPEDLCADTLTTPPCEVVNDDMAAFLGNIQDLIDELKVRAEAEEKFCEESLEAYSSQIKDLRRQHDDGGVSLANLMEEQSERETQRREQRRGLLDVLKDVNEGVRQCEEQIVDLTATLCSTRKLRQELQDGGVSNGGFIGDCQVTDWVMEGCSKECGAGGVENLTRRVIFKPEGNATICPPTRTMRSCNERPCPIDGLMGRWTPWSRCSRACGGGTKTRHRRVIREAQHGGLPAAETMQERPCNAQPCDRDCVLTHWSDWSGCSKVCGGGHQLRKRHVRQPALGEGGCPGAEDKERKQWIECNKVACKADPPKKCASHLDVVFAVDTSGTVLQSGVSASTGFLKAIAERTVLGENGTQLGAVYFSDSAVVAEALTPDKEAFDAKVDAIKWLKKTTNTGEALALSAELLESKARPTSSHAVVIITDGMPTSSYIMSTEAKRLKDKGIRVVLVTVGPSLSPRAMEKWASWPASENVIRVGSWMQLDAEKTTQLLANLCPEFA